MLTQGLSSLSSLTRLTKVSFTGIVLSDEALVGIATCSQLRDLKLKAQGDPDMPTTAAGLMHLTKLTRLFSLKLVVELHEPQTKVFRCNLVRSVVGLLVVQQL